MKFMTRILAVALLVAFYCQSQADVIEYGNFDGATVTYIDVTESSTDPVPLYGQPEIFGDRLHMPGTGFATESKNGEIEFLDGRLTFMIEADPGTTLSSVTIREFGAYFTFGQSSIAQVNAIAFAQTLEGDLVSSIFNFNAPASNSTQSGDWIESLTLFFPETTKVTITLDNQLFTFADAFGVAFIDKKGIDIIPGGEIVPEPASAAILLIGLAGFAIRRRR